MMVVVPLKSGVTEKQIKAAATAATTTLLSARS